MLILQVGRSPLENHWPIKSLCMRSQTAVCRPGLFFGIYVPGCPASSHPPYFLILYLHVTFSCDVCIDFLSSLHASKTAERIVGSRCTPIDFMRAVIGWTIWECKLLFDNFIWSSGCILCHRLVMPFAEKGNREEEWLERKEPRHCTCEQSVRHTQVELSHGQVHEAQKRGQDWRLKTTWKWAYRRYLKPLTEST